MVWQIQWWATVRVEMCTWCYYYWLIPADSHRWMGEHQGGIFHPPPPSTLLDSRRCGWGIPLILYTVQLNVLLLRNECGNLIRREGGVKQQQFQGATKNQYGGSSVAILEGFNFYGVCNSLEGGNENHWNLRYACKGIFVSQGDYCLRNMKKSPHDSYIVVGDIT